MSPEGNCFHPKEGVRILLGEDKVSSARVYSGLSKFYLERKGICRYKYKASQGEEGIESYALTKATLRDNSKEAQALSRR